MNYVHDWVYVNENLAKIWNILQIFYLSHSYYLSLNFTIISNCIQYNNYQKFWQYAYKTLLISVNSSRIQQLAGMLNDQS